MTELELAYIAGLFDGEGCFGFNKMKTKRSSRGYIYVGRFSIVNTNLEVLNWVKLMLGTGSIYRRDRTKQGWKTCYELCWMANQAKQILPQLIPYLRIKKAQAELLYEYLCRRCHTGRGHPISENEWGVREGIVNRVRAINKRGI